MRAYRSCLSLGALTLTGLAATILVQGGWQAAVAGVGALAGIGCAVSYAVLRAAADGPRPRRPGWAQNTPAPRATAAEAGVPRPAARDRGRAAASAGRHAPSPARPQPVH